MRQDKTYVLDDNAGNTFYAIIELDERGLDIFLFKEEPSKYTEEEQALASIEIAIEESADALRVLLLAWDDRTDREKEISSSCITIIEEEKQ